MSNKQFGTLCSRQQHFVEFLDYTKLGKNVALKGFSLSTRNTIMACYTAHLATGHTLLCKSIKSSTISRYLSAAAELSIPAKMMNPCLDIMGNVSKEIKDILNELKRWESMPKRREPMTKEMISYIIDKGEKLKSTNPDNIYTVLSDWLIVGLQAGFRRKEWAQDKTYLKKYKDIERNVDGSSAAFILSDFEFRGKGNTRIDNSSKQAINRSYIVNIKWRFQKNNDNGQVISYTKNTEDKKFCVVEACKRIHHRVIKFKIPANKPIAVFTASRSIQEKPKYIDDVHIKSILQEAARRVYNIKCKKDLSNFTSHSVRVGACVLLHAQNVSPEDIKFRLRWRSDTFRTYLRNILPLAERHTDAITNAK